MRRRSMLVHQLTQNNNREKEQNPKHIALSVTFFVSVKHKTWRGQLIGIPLEKASPQLCSCGYMCGVCMCVSSGQSFSVLLLSPFPQSLLWR